MYMNPIAVLKSNNDFELVKNGKEITSSIIDTVYKDEFFYFEPSEETWLKV